MEHKEHDRVLAFDTLFTTNQCRMLKTVMPFFDVSMQRHLAIYIKYLELQYALTYFKKNPFPPFSGACDTHNIFQDILPYCSPDEKQKISQFENIFSAMENYRNMMEMMSMMKEMFPQGEGTPDSDILSGLFGGGGDMNEMGSLFDMFQMFQNNNHNDNT